jgi:hypothetical protein
MLVIAPVKSNVGNSIVIVVRKVVLNPVKNIDAQLHKYVKKIMKKSSRLKIAFLR